ncbi:TonB-dependent receptor [Olivibacter domesticus]|uniref:TonB-dependent Receptor Plug Domain n=1 Tax=Olivibacter domesticus TaxID=407022 RepID=A0A1H7MTF8_OLID1|nr:TonB-dependent receptor [Olivibacter domesticus]SEL14493.1 TonB-dependent Receptor Plug Domain [Olivibacter domesticus]
MFTNLKATLKFYLLIIVLFSITINVYGQSDPGGTINGVVQTNDGKPAEFSTVNLNGKESIKVDKEGRYSFKNLASGQYTLTVSFVGLQPQTKTVTLAAGETFTVDFTLSADAQALSEVLIVGEKYTITSKKESEDVARLPLKNLENPQVYSVVDKELIKEQMALTLEESFRNVPGAAPAKTGAGMPSFFSRGFQTSENFRNGMATYLRTGIDLASVERVETIKGPTSTLFGAQMTSFGGIVNYITKKPYDTFGGEVSYTMGSWDLNRITADINAPIKAEDGLLFRVNVARQNENTFQDQGNNATMLVAPSISYQVNDRLKLLLDADFLSVKGITPAGWFVSPTLQSKSFDELNLDYKESLNDNSLVSKQTSSNVLFQAEYKLSDKWLSQTKYAWGGGAYDDLYIFDFIWQEESSVNRILRAFTDEKTARKNFQQNFIGDFTIGSLRNRLVVGLDYLTNYRKTRYDGLGYGGAVFAPANLNDLPSTPVIRMEEVQTILAERNTGQNITKESSYSAYASDVLNLTDQLTVMASLRVDRFISDGTTNTLSRVKTGDYTQTAFSPKFGLVYQIVKEKVSLFANYLNGFKNLGNRIQPNGDISVFKPQQAGQWEGGLKVDLSDKFNATVSYYNIDVTNSTRTEVRDSMNFTVQDGTQNSKGIEVEIIGKPFAGFNYVASYGYNDNKFTKANDNVVGKRALGTPEHVLNVWVSYALIHGKARGLGVGVGNSYVSDAYLDNTNTFTLSSYNLLDATLFYNQPKYSIRLKANNILDEQYWVSDGYYARPQKPANFMASIAYKF